MLLREAARRTPATHSSGDGFLYKFAAADGAYLAGPLGHCIECHTPMGPQGPDFQNSLGAGGMEFHGPWGVSVAANITPTGLDRYTDDEVIQIITTGVRPDGSRLLPPMGIPYYAKMTGTDLRALVAWLRTLPPDRPTRPEHPGRS